jgi:flagellar motility protein MotE (MotC chaperone)
MKQMLLVLVVGMTLFGVSGGVSFYLQQQQLKKDAEVGTAVNDKPFAKAPIGSRSASFQDAQTLPGAVRPAPTTSPEQIAQVVTSISKQQESLKAQEQNLLVRQKHLELIHEDLRGERKTVDALRQQVAAEMKALTDKLNILENKANDIDKQKKKIQDLDEQVKQSMFEMDSVEQKRIKQIASMYDSMEAQVAGGLLQEMADTGKMDTAVKILSNMQPRQSAKVLTEMEDRGTAVQILDKLRGLKRTTP